MLKKALAISLALSMILGGLVGCGSKSGSDSKSSSAGGEAPAATTSDTQAPAEEAGQEEVYEPITIEFWNSWTGSDGATLTELVNKFNETNKWNITVEMDISSQFSQKFQTAAPAGEAADLVFMSSTGQWTYLEFLTPIDDIWDNTELKREDFIDDSIEKLSKDGKLYGLPFQNSVYYLYWNKDLFEAAGLDPETPPTTFEEWSEMANKITNPSENVFGAGVFTNGGQIDALMQRWGKRKVEEEDGKFYANCVGNEDFKRFFRWEKALVDAGDCPVGEDLATMFKAGKIGIMVDGGWLSMGARENNMNYGMAPLPYEAAGKRHVGGLTGFAVTTSAGEAEKLACERFMQWWYMGNQEGDDITEAGDYSWSTMIGYTSNYIPTTKEDGYINDELLKQIILPDDVPLMQEQCPETFKGAGRLGTITNTMNEAVMYGTDLENDIEEALRVAQEEIEAVIIEFHGEEGLLRK